MARTEHQKELLAAYRERPITGAVCAVTDTVSGRTLLLASPNPAGQRNRFQFAVSTDMPLHPAKRYPRSETVDFQRGEVEWRGGNLYFTQWSYDMQIEYLDN